MRRCEIVVIGIPWSKSGVAIIASDGLALLSEKKL